MVGTGLSQCPRSYPPHNGLPVCGCRIYASGARGGKDAAIQAARLYGTIQALEERSGVALSPYYHHLNQLRVRFALQQLTKQEWEAEFMAGQQWSVETALAQAIIEIRR